MVIRRLPLALLEEWMRKYYFTTEIDIGSSGVEEFSLAELRALLGLTYDDFDRVVFRDSQSLGCPGLREAIARRWTGDDVGRAMATHGSSEANFLVMNALLHPGDEVIVLDPCYQQLYSLAETIGCRLHRWPLRLEQRFIPDLEDIKKLIGRRTRMVIVNFPHNPTGASLALEQQDMLIDMLSKYGIFLLWDSAFAEITYKHPPLPDPITKYDRAISIGTLSKTYGLPGLRVGWCLASPEILSRLIRLRDYITLHLSPLVELIAQRVIEKAEDLIASRLKLARSNLVVLTDWFEENEQLVEFVSPQGGVCVFPRLAGVQDDVSFCSGLAREYKVLLVPGTCFNFPGHVRLGFGGQTTKLKEGLACLSALLKRTRNGTKLGRQVTLTPDFLNILKS
jgi:capreomycidine synthase